MSTISIFITHGDALCFYVTPSSLGHILSLTHFHRRKQEKLFNSWIFYVILFVRTCPRLSPFSSLQGCCAKFTTSSKELSIPIKIICQSISKVLLRQRRQEGSSERKSFFLDWFVSFEIAREEIFAFCLFTAFFPHLHLHSSKQSSAWESNFNSSHHNKLRIEVGIANDEMMKRRRRWWWRHEKFYFCLLK